MTIPNVMYVAPMEPIFLKIKGGWINPMSIGHVQTHRANEAMLIIGVTGVAQPIPLNETDSAYVAEYLESRTWRPAPATIFADDSTMDSPVADMVAT